MKQTAIAVLIAVGIAAPTIALSQEFAGGLSIGTPGLGAVIEAKTSETLVIRGAIDGMSLNRDETYSDVAYSGKAKVLTGGVFADLHPGGGGFLVSGGAYFGKRRLELDGRPAGNVEIGGTTYTPAQVGRIQGEAKLSKFQPFLGVGYDNTFVGDRAWGFRALVGVSFSKKPKVDLTASGGTLSSDPTFLTRLAQEEAEVRDDAKSFRYYPVVQLGLTRRF